MSKDIVLAFSGGLDTSFCVPYLQEQGWAVHTVFADTGGVDAEERAFIEQRAQELGVASHVTVDGGPAIWDGFVKPFVWAGEGYQGQYPLLVSDRYLIVDAALKRAAELGTRAIAHGCTGMGNDQVRFDLAVKAQGDYQIVAPIREIQKEHTQTRAYEQAYLEERGFGVRAKQQAYTINENLLGVTMSGGEIDHWKAPGEGARGWCKPRAEWPSETLQVTLGFDEGEAVTLDGEKLPGDADAGQAQRAVRAVRRGPRHVHRRHHDRPEGPHRVRSAGPDLAADRAPRAGRSGADQAAEPLQAGGGAQVGGAGLRRLLPRPAEDRPGGLPGVQPGQRQRRSGAGNHAAARSMRWRSQSPHILNAKGATYAQSADWGVEEAEGFIKLFGMSSHPVGRGQPSGEQGERPNMGDFSISTDKDRLDIGLIHRFLAGEAYWCRGIPRDVVERAIAGSLCFGGYLDGGQVAFARVVTDGATFAYLADVFVLPDHRGHGYSKQLVAAVMAHPSLQGLRRFMLATSDAHALYARHGFATPAHPATLMEKLVPDVYTALA